MENMSSLELKIPIGLNNSIKQYADNKNISVDLLVAESLALLLNLNKFPLTYEGYVNLKKHLEKILDNEVRTKNLEDDLKGTDIINLEKEVKNILLKISDKAPEDEWDRLD